MTTSDRVTLRAAAPSDANAPHALISSHLEEGHWLPRRLDERTVHASRFVVAVWRRRIVGCAELAPFSSQPAEVRWLAVQEKIFTDCVNCPKFRTCGQFAVGVALEPPGASARDEAAAVLHYA